MERLILEDQHERRWVRVSDSKKPIAAATLGRKITNQYSKAEYNELEGNSFELVIDRADLRSIVEFLDNEIPLLFPELVFGVDNEEGKFDVVYIFYSRIDGLLIQLRIHLVEPDLTVPTLSDIFQGLEWHERETHEMFGILFDGHPDLRLLLLPDELDGAYPLRKSFVTDRSRVAESGLPQPKPRPPSKTKGDEK